jgi:hypothetical protein
MDRSILDGTVYKFSGRVEHWVTTYYQGFWGLPEGQESKWHDISMGDTFLFHATGPKYVDAGDAGGGVIGVGTVGGFDTKEDPVWLEEVQGGRMYPYLIYFDEMYWFGNDQDVRDAPVAEKSEAEIIDDCHRFSENILSFGEMRDQTGYSFNPMGVMSEVKEIHKLRPLLYGRLRGREPDTRETPSGDRETGSTGGERFTGSQRRSRSGASQTTLDESSQKYEVEVTPAETQRKSRHHERILDTVEERLEQSGYETWETQHSDLVASRDEATILGEAKTIHPKNERKRLREAIGQLHEYRFHDVRQDDDLHDDPDLFLILSQQPSDYYSAYLRDLHRDGLYTIWVDGDAGEINGFDDSIRRFESLL